MSHIRLHPERGIDPHLCFCPRCGGDTNGITMGHIRVALNNDGTIAGYFQVGDVRPKELQGLEWRELGEREKVPGDICDSCEEELKSFKEEVAAGGIYWKCEECHHEGVIKAGAPLAVHVREHMKIAAPNPCGIEFDYCTQHTPQENNPGS